MRSSTPADPVRPAEPAEPAAPVEMVVASFDDPIVTGLRAEQEAETAARSGIGGPAPGDTGITFLVARQAGGVIGCTGLRRLGDDAAEIMRVYVRPGSRGLGVSRLLLAGVEDLARRRGCTVARLDARRLDDAELYRSSGYARVPASGARAARGPWLERSLRDEAPRITG